MNEIRQRCECHECTQSRFPSVPWFATRTSLGAIDAVGLTDQQAAINAERERCAKIADKYADDPHGSNPSCATAEAIAAEIRNGE